MTVEARFMKFVYPEPNSGCWLWDGELNSNGYGQFRCQGKRWLSHRFSYEHFVGTIGSVYGVRSVCVCHKCDVRACVNPDHLFLGTQSENIMDSFLKGRNRLAEFTVRGEMHHKAKLSESDVVSVRKMLSDGKMQAEIAKTFGVSRQLVSEIKRRRVWKHV